MKRTSISSFVISIQTVETDVVVFAVGHFLSLDIEELWINFGFEKHHRNFVAHAILRFVNERAKSLIMFHALIGCDSVWFSWAR